MARKDSANMLEGSIADKLIYFALPLAASSMLQQLFNAADTAVVGRFAGSDALAAVGANGAICSLFIAALTGLSIGANVVIAQYIGANRLDKIKDTVHTVVLFALLGGLVVCGIGEVVAKWLLELIGTPDNVINLASVYLRIYLMGIPFISLFNFGSAIVRSSGDTKRPMYCLIVAGVLNLILNLILVIVFKMSVAGVAIATTVSNIVSSLMITYMLTKEEGMLHLDLTKLKIHKEPLMKILKTGLPASIQGMVFSVANISIQSGINSFGSNAIAGNSAAGNFEIMGYFLCNAFNQTAVTFIGQNYAAGKYDRCKKIHKLCLLESIVGMIVLEGAFYLGRHTFIQIFTTDPDVISYAMIKMLWCMVPHFMISSYEITASVLRGMGYSMQPTIITIVGCVGFRVGWLVTVFKHWHDFSVLLAVYPASWVVTGTLMIGAYIILSKKAYKV